MYFPTETVLHTVSRFPGSLQTYLAYNVLSEMLGGPGEKEAY